MKLYADSSWWLAFKCRSDVHHRAALSLFDQEPEGQVIWTPWQRVEVFNNFRQIERAGLIARGESKQIIRLLEQEIRLGYWPHVEFDWTDASRTACELAAEHGLNFSIRSMDLFHVAIAIESAADAFISFDDDQCALAEASGLRLLRLSTRKR